MFENLIKDTSFPTLIGLIDAVDKSLAGVRERLAEQAAEKDHVRAMVAEAQLDALAAWEPALREIREYLAAQIAPHPAPSHPQVGGGHR